MNDLIVLKKRIKGARLWSGLKIDKSRLYFTFKRPTGDTKINTWFEIINDHLEPCVSVIKTRGRDEEYERYRDENSERRIKSEIYAQFSEIINDCELERRKIPLEQRLSDNIDPIYDERSALHQVLALQFLCTMKVSALYGDVGTMKTKIAIDLCVSRYLSGEIKKVLVFLPVSTKKNFMEQVNTWCTESGIKWKLVGEESMGSSERAIFDALDYVDNQTQIIIDESHMIKNPSAKRSIRIKSVCDKASYKLLMTGTPITENVHNLYMQYACLSDLIIKVNNWKKFEEMFLIMGGNCHDEILGYKNLDYLMGLIEPYTYQIDASVLNLPVSVHQVYTCDMSNEQEMLYNIEKENLLDLIKKDEVKVTDIFQTFTRMQQITCGFLQGKRIFNFKKDLLEEIELPGKVVIFCKYLIEIEMVKEIFGAENCAIFTGMNPKTRDEEKDSFVKGDKRFFVATMQSGGTGLNGMQEVCDTVVFFSQSFSYFLRKQSIGRLERKGQKNTVTIIDLRTTAKIDGRILGALQRKNDLVKEIKNLIEDKTKLKEYVESL